MKARLATALIALMVASPCAGQTVTDGDTLKHNGTIYRPWGIDAPMLLAQAPAQPPPAVAPAPHTSRKPVPGALAKEPGLTDLPRGTIVLVDDGSCPADQIKQVTGGSTNQNIPRGRKCIPRPN